MMMRIWADCLIWYITTTFRFRWYFPKDWILGRLGGVSSTADDKSNGNLFVPGSPENLGRVVVEQWGGQDGEGGVFMNERRRWDKFFVWLLLCVLDKTQGWGLHEEHKLQEIELEYCHFQMRHCQSRICCLYSTRCLHPSISLKQNSWFLGISNTLPLSPFPQVGHAFLLRQCHSYVQIGSRSCAACHWSFCRSFGKEAWWLEELWWVGVTCGWCGGAVGDLVGSFVVCWWVGMFGGGWELLWLVGDWWLVLGGGGSWPVVVVKRDPLDR